MKEFHHVGSCKRRNHRHFLHDFDISNLHRPTGPSLDILRSLPYTPSSSYDIPMSSSS